MFESLLNAEVQFAALSVLIWSVAAVVISRKPVERSPRRTKARATTLLVLLTLGCLMAAARVVTVALMGNVSWLFAADRVAVAVPLLVLPAIAAVFGAGPRVLAWRRNPGYEARRATFVPRAVVPLQIAALGAVVGFYTTLVQVVPAPLLRPALTTHAAVLSVTAAAWALQSRRTRLQRQRAPISRLTRPLRVLRAAAVVTAVAVVVGVGLSTAATHSKLPTNMSMAEHHAHGDHSHGDEHGGGDLSRSVETLTGPRDREPDRRYTLVADEKTVQLASGRTAKLWAFNGKIPGPELRVREGELVEITLKNKLDRTNVSVHWHGVDVPNAEDGVPGVTQNAVKPGGTHVYRFAPEEVGTHWYHSHQQASKQVQKGLFGALVIEPRKDTPVDHDWFLPMHTWDVDGDADPVPAFGLSDELEHRRARPGAKVRLRLLNSDRFTHRFSVTGTAFRVTAIDGNPIHEPTAIRDRSLVVGSGGRYDVEFTMPDRPVRVTEVQDSVGARDRGVAISADGASAPEPTIPESDFDPVGYGSPTEIPFESDSGFDSEHDMVFDNEIGFYDGRLAATWSINGKVFPDIPAITVREGDLVRMKFANRSRYDHPMHLHGHHVLVLSRNGKPSSGSPLWLDTVNVEVGDVWEVAFRADNPGIWMDHCHIGDHTVLGMMTHLNYENVTSPYRVGPETGNIAE